MTHHQRRHVCLSALGLATSALLPLRTAHAQAIDTARIITGFPPGSTPDVLSRRVADRLVSGYAKNVIVENRTGAGGQLAATTVKTAPADGSAILMTPLAVLGLYPLTYNTLPYNVDNDFAPVSLGVKFDIALAVGTGVPAEVKTLADFIQWARANPSRANVGLPALGSPMHFAAVELARLSNVPMQQVGYRGTVAAIPELLGGQLPAMVSPIGEFIRHIPEGKIRVLATSGAARSRFTPQVATFAEQGFKDLQFQDYFGFYLPIKCSSAQVQATSAAIGQALAHPQVKESLDVFGMEVAASTPDELRTILRNYTARWAPVVKATGFKAD